MANGSGRDHLSVRAKLQRLQVRVRRSCRQIWALYRNCLDATFLLRALRQRNCAPLNSASNLNRVDSLRLPAATSRAQAVGLALAAIVAAVVVTGYWCSAEWRLAQEQTLVTGATKRTQALSDGSEVSLSANSVLTVDDTGQERVAFQEAGEITYNIKAIPTRPFILQTLRATAIVMADATLRVAIGSQIEFEVIAGAVKIAIQGAKPNAPARWLHKGESLRLPIDGTRSVLASSCIGSASVAV
jgi:ferric-dicitrate binding protein FerR (iron transport regulator)